MESFHYMVLYKKELGKRVLGPAAIFSKIFMEEPDGTTG
jgi:hypothetical protein